MSTSSRRDQNAALQRVIDHLARDGEGRPVADLVGELEQTMLDHDLPAQPDTWVRAVASAAAVGNPYVVSRESAQRADVTGPDTPEHPYSVT